MLKKNLILICSCLFAVSLQATVRYVKPDGTVAEQAANAVSWTTACSDLQAVVNASAANDEIWVATGIYKPNRRANATETITDNDRDNAFVFKKDVKIYGGFAGTETALTQRNLSGEYSSVLSGDFNGDDSGSAGMNENAYHVVIFADNAGVACLDGFTVTGGNADGSGSILVNSTTIYQCAGGGIHISSSSPTLTNVNVSGNNATCDGGGVYCGYSSSILTNVNISRNIASFGGGMQNYHSTTVLTNVIISGNIVYQYGGGMSIDYSSPVLTNVCVSGNVAGRGGGGVYNWSSSPQVRNSIIWSNGIASTNVAIVGSPAPAYSYSLVQGSGGSNSWNNLLGIDNGNNIDADPLFTGDLRLKENSPCIDAGNKSFFCQGEDPELSNITTDLAGNPRIYGNEIDLGAYEFQGATSIKIPSKGSKLLVYPNPTRGVLRIDSVDGKIDKIQLFDIHGKLIMQPTQPEFDMSVLPKGIYLLKVNSEMMKVVKI